MVSAPRDDSSQKRTAVVKRLKISLMDRACFAALQAERGLKVCSSGKEEEAETQEIRKGKPSVWTLRPTRRRDTEVWPQPLQAMLQRTGTKARIQEVYVSDLACPGQKLWGESFRSQTTSRLRLPT